MGYRQLRIISGKGSGPAQFVGALRGIALDGQGRIYVAGDSEVKVFEAAGRLARRWAVHSAPHSVGIAADGSVWVGQAGQVEVFNAAARLTRTWSDNARMGRVTAIGFFKESVLIGDSAQRCIHRFDLSGKFLNTIGKDNPLEGLHIPNGVVDFGIDAAGVVHVANPGKHRVERYSLEGRLLGHFGKFTGSDPSGFSGCCNPTNVAVSGTDAVCVTEKAGPRAKIYSQSGSLQAILESADFDPNTKNMDIALDARGLIYVSDPVRSHVVVFGHEGGPAQ